MYTYTQTYVLTYTGQQAELFFLVVVFNVHVVQYNLVEAYFNNDFILNTGMASGQATEDEQVHAKSQSILKFFDFNRYFNLIDVFNPHGKIPFTARINILRKIYSSMTLLFFFEPLPIGNLIFMRFQSNYPFSDIARNAMKDR